MNDRIKQLTRNYLNNFYPLNDNQKQKIIEINSQTEWIIFNAGSLKGKRLDAWEITHYRALIENAEYSSETYDINDSNLANIFKEVIKTYGSEEVDRNNIEVKLFQFIGGGGNIERAGHLIKKHAIPLATFGGKGDSDCWVAINKKVSGENFETIFLAGDLCFNNDRSHWKTERNLNNLLNDNSITNSRERERERESMGTPPPTTPDNSSTGTNFPNNQNQTPPRNESNHWSSETNSSNNQNQTPPTQTIQFTIKKTNEFFPDYFLYFLETSPFVVNGSTITKITIDGNQVKTLFQSGGLQAGNTISITDIQLEEGRASIVNDNELYISGFFADIQVVSRATGSTSSTPPQNTPQLFPEVHQANQAWIKEENDLVILAAELLHLIDENKKIVQEAQNFGLNLPEFPPDTLDYFQEEFFFLLDETLSLDNPQNKQTNDDNEKIKQKKKNIKQNVNRIYNDNKKKLAEVKTGQKPPKNELEEKKKEIKEKINKVLTDKDNLRNIDLTTLENGKYQNWEQDIEKLNTPAEVENYGRVFLTVLVKTGAKEKEQEKKEKNNNRSTDSPQIVPKKNIVDQDFKDKMNNLSLVTAKSIAKTKIRELFKKYQPDIEKLKEIWQGEESWMSYLEKCDDSKKIIAFLEKLEQAIIQQKTATSPKQKKLASQEKSISSNFWIIPSVIGGLIIMIIGLVLVLRSKRVAKRKRRKT